MQPQQPNIAKSGEVHNWWVFITFHMHMGLIKNLLQTASNHIVSISLNTIIIGTMNIK